MSTLAPPQAPATRRRPQPLLWRIQALLSSYLPLLLMAFLAAGTGWLVKNTPEVGGPTEPVPPRHEPDFRMQGFELQRFDDKGALRFRVEGSEMRHYPDTDTLEIDGVRLRGVGQDGALTLATARRALSNGDASELQLMGEVRVQRFAVRPDGAPAEQAGLELRGEFVRALLDSEQLSSHLPIELSYGGGRIAAQSFRYDHLRGLLTFSGRSQARIDAGRKP